MPAPDLNAQLQEAITLAQAGQRAEARALLDRIVAADPTMELAWMWLATVSPDREERVAFLERALALNPDNPTTRQAYAQLTGQEYVPPEAPPPTTARRMLASLGEEAPLSLRNFAIILVVAAVAVVAVMVAINARGDDNKVAPTLTPRLILPPDSPTPTSRYSPTPSQSPFPTRTPGPSPTPFDWEQAPTWTPVPTLTRAPSLTPLPSSTPQPTRTDTPTPAPVTRTFTPLPPTATDTPSETPGAATLTAAVVLTSDGASTVTQTAPAGTGE